jgi:hypothetical protein
MRRGQSFFGEKCGDKLLGGRWLVGIWCVK